MDAYAIREAAWHVECASIEAEWNKQRDQAHKVHKCAPKKPTPPTKLKRPAKPKGVSVGKQNARMSAGKSAEESAGEGTEEQGDEAKLIDRLQDMKLGRFAEIV